MTGGTVFRCGLVEKYIPAVYGSGRFVTGYAIHIAVRTLQRKGGFLVVIKPRGPPLRTVVTAPAIGHASFRKLHAMNVRVARLALRRRLLEI